MANRTTLSDAIFSKTLHSLYLENCSLDLPLLTAVLKPYSLQTFGIMNTPSHPLPELKPFIDSMNTHPLSSLALVGCSLDTKKVTEILHSPTLKQLTTLDLSDNDLPCDFLLEDWKKNSLTSLRSSSAIFLPKLTHLTLTASNLNKEKYSHSKVVKLLKNPPPTSILGRFKENKSCTLKLGDIPASTENSPIDASLKNLLTPLRSLLGERLQYADLKIITPLLLPNKKSTSL